MAVIKQSRSEDILKEAVVLDLADLSRQAERIMSDARAQAESIIQDGRTEAQRLIDQADEAGHKQGYERGHAEGLEQGRADGRKEVIESLKPQLEAIVASWNKALEQWETDREDLLSHAREDVITFAFKLARKITGRVIDSDPSVVRDQLAHALQLLSGPTAMTVRVHPEDKAIIEDVLPELLNQYVGCEHASVRDDPAVSRGGCRVTTSGGGEIDATIETQLKRLAEDLLPPDRARHVQSPPDDSANARPEVDE